jgi:uncharacterized protein (TIGR02611 family)
MIERVRTRKHEHRQRGALYRVSFAIGGVLLILAGLVLAAPGVPGPGLLVVGVGLAMLALEFDWAERLLERILDRVERVAETSRWQRVALIVAGVAMAAGALALVLFWDLPLVPL